MKTLLAAVDFSDASAKVISKAHELAKALSARIVFVHIVEPVANYVPVGAAMDVIETTPPPMVELDTEPQKKRLNGFVEAATQAGIGAEAHVILGLPAEEIVTAAESQGADTILIGSHGHGALYNLFAGSVVTGILKRSEIPVLVVPIPKKDER
ncbi:MAG: universal stress protein [Chthoniobacterales bacterium]